MNVCILKNQLKNRKNFFFFISMKNYYNTTSIQKQQQNDRPSLRLNVNVDSSLNRRSKSSSSSPLTATRSNYSPFFSLNYNAERLFPLRKKIYIGKMKHIHNRTSDDDDYYDDDDDYPEHFKWIDYGNMKPKQIEAIKSFCCNQSILFVSCLFSKIYQWPFDFFSIQL